MWGFSKHCRYHTWNEIQDAAQIPINPETWDKDNDALPDDEHVDIYIINIRCMVCTILYTQRYSEAFNEDNACHTRVEEN